MDDLEARVAERVKGEFHPRKVRTHIEDDLYSGVFLKDVVEVEKRLGKGTFELYKFIYGNSRDLPKRRCGNDVVSHWFEVGGRAHSLDFEVPYVRAGLLHDIIEGKAKTLEDTLKWKKEISKRFGEDTAKNVGELTNHYSIIIGCIENITEGMASRYSKKSMLDALKYIRGDERGIVSIQFGQQFKNLENTIRNLNMQEVYQEVNRKKREDEEYSVFKELKSRAYNNYIRDMFKDAEERLNDKEERYDVAIVDKGLDNMDNLRTMGFEIPVIEKTLGKVDIYLKHCKEFMNNLPEGKENEKLLIVYSALKEQIVQQLMERKYTLGGMSDIRFEHVSALYLDEKINFYAGEFGLDVNPIKERVLGYMGARLASEGVALVPIKGVDK